MRIPPDQFESCIEHLEAEERDPRIGLFGPGSTVWRLSRESVIMFGGGRAALMQIAHPQVAWAVAGHSAVMSDVAGRFRRTFDNVFAMTFGDRDRALRRARRVRTIHEHVHGTIGEDVGGYREGDRFDALDADATLWVAATLWDTTMLVYELLVGPVSPPDKERFYRESFRFVQMFGLRREDLPPTWIDFQRYVDETLASGELGVGRVGRELADHITAPPRLAAAPAYRWLESFTAAILPASLREPFGLSWRRRDELLFGVSVAAIRNGVPFLPASLRYFPGYLDARRRLAGEEGRDPIGALVEQLVIAGLEPGGLDR